jgi:hypothetical protein
LKAQGNLPMSWIHRRAWLAGAAVAVCAASTASATSLAPFVEARFALRSEALNAPTPSAAAAAAFLADLTTALKPIAPRVSVRAGPGAQIILRGEEEGPVAAARELLNQIKPFALVARSGAPALARTDGLASFSPGPRPHEVRLSLTAQAKAALAPTVQAGRTLTLLHGVAPIASGQAQFDTQSGALTFIAPQMRADLGRWNSRLTLARHGLRAELISLTRYPEP